MSIVGEIQFNLLVSQVAVKFQLSPLVLVIVVAQEEVSIAQRDEGTTNVEVRNNSNDFNLTIILPK